MINDLESIEFAFPILHEDLNIIVMNWWYFVLLKFIITTKFTVYCLMKYLG